jgi:hypothetical protein
MFAVTSYIQYGMRERLQLICGSSERYILLDEYLPEGLCRTTRKDGCVWEQSCDIQAGWDDSRDCVGTLVYMGLFLLRSA